MITGMNDFIYTLPSEKKNLLKYPTHFYTPVKDGTLYAVYSPSVCPDFVGRSRVSPPRKPFGVQYHNLFRDFPDFHTIYHYSASNLNFLQLLYS
jgi:hypothetical protein